MIMKFFITCCLMFIAASSHGQSFSINTDGSTANASAILDVKSTAKGMLIPRMSKTEKNAIAAPATGLLIFQNAPDSIGFYYYSGTSWLWLEVLGTAGWKTKGNAGTDTSVNFIGTTDAMPLRFKQNNQWLGQFNNNNGTYFIGRDAGKKNTAVGSIAIGDSAMSNNTNAIGNLAVGHLALKSNITGNYNTAIGIGSLEVNNSSTGFNTAIGSYAIYKNTTGVAMTAVGTGALYDDISIGFNTALGFNSLGSNTTGIANTALGTNTMVINQTGEFNVAIGNNAMYNADKADQNVAIGGETLHDDTTGYNTAVGTLSMRYNKAGIYGTAIGYSSLYNNLSGLLNTSIGTFSMYSNTTGNYNSVLGARALYKNTTGSHNVVIGDSAGHTNSSGSSNVFVGHVAGFGNINRSSLVMIGDSAGYASNIGSELVFIGASAGRHHRLNDGNVYIGVRAGYSDSTGILNTFIGNESGYNTKAAFPSSARANTFVGHQAGYTNITGLYNTTIGYNADVISTNLSNATAIGAFATVDQDNSLVLGSISGVNGATANTKVGIGTTTPQYGLHIISTDAQSGGIMEGIMIENTASPIANVGEAAINFRNIAIPSNYEWTMGMNQNPNFTITYGNDFNSGNTKMVIDTFGRVGIGLTAPTALIDVDGTYKLGTNGTINTALLKDTVTINVGSVPANGELDVTVALANATLNGAVSVSPATDIESGLVIAWARVSAAGTIKIRYRNLTGAIINPASTNYYISVVQ
jgi:hypothetical protein